MAAGFGTRLAPYTDTIPKALFPVGGTPVLGRMIVHLKRAGCTEVAVNTHHLADQIHAYLSASDFGLPVHLSRETAILGTGGAIRQLAAFWDAEPFVVVNADIVTDIDIARVYETHRRAYRTVTLVMHDRPPFNQVWIDTNNCIRGFSRFSGRATPPGQRKLAFTGIHVMDRRIVERIPDHGFCDIISVYQQMIDDGMPIHAHVTDGHYWQDMGDPQRYRDAVVDAMAADVFQSVFGGTPPAAIDCRPLSGDGSDRGWFRLKSGTQQLILADHGITPDPTGSEFNAFVNIGDHLYRSGLPVPRIHARDPFSGLVFLEDLGDCHLQQAVNQARTPDAVERHYRQVIDVWINLTAKAADTFDPSWTCQSPAYDVALILEKECRYFVDAFLNGFLNLAVDYADLHKEFTQLAQATMANAIEGLIHRDFQSRNIMIRGGRPYLIDFQGARKGPIQYDLASLLIDPYINLDTGLRQRLLQTAVEPVSHRRRCDPDQFMRGYHCCTVTRNLQMLGAFGFLSRVKKKTEFEKWIPAAAGMLENHIQRLEGLHLPQLRAVAQKIARLTARRGVVTGKRKMPDP
ncbi:hypothetical protein DSCO28_01090 [Desulfosarcina ovata subsp. sediminis]|uniref:Aminoglycoside phosphotransferase n=1 Tax=Desulfosarcina ovata subsp. sediminis TaxID=885957 RepID=A0A5K7ZQH1_9BACT|nr:hypothetical protein DSCO28_01090 [Desulfosarcina ovata subsp. sediminis]